MMTSSSKKWEITKAFLGAHKRFYTLKGEKLHHYQDTMASNMVNFARSHSPYYQGLFRDYAKTSWTELPLTNKKAMMSNLGDINSKGLSTQEILWIASQRDRGDFSSSQLKGVTLGLSSGTSKIRGVFMASSKERALWAGTILARCLPSVRPHRIALFLRSNSNLYETINSFLIKFSYYDLMTPLQKICDSLEQQNPTILVAPPSVLVCLARKKIQGILKINPVKVISVAEVLDPQDTTIIESVFNTTVHQIYQCTEGFIAATCHRGRLHIQEDIVAIQCDPLDADSHRFAPIVTDLWRQTQPIIRYRLDDILVFEKDECSCGSGFRVIARIEGRTDDCLFFLGPDKKKQTIFPDTLKEIMAKFGKYLDDYQIYQDEPGSIRIVFDTSRTFAEVSKKLEKHFRHFFSTKSLEIKKFETEGPIKVDDPNKKKRRVINLDPEGFE